MKLMKKGLVLEGGAMRGLFTCGVIDVFLENDIRFDGAVGISAGAVFGCNYKSRQHGRPLRYNTTFCKDPRYGTFKSFLKTGDLFDVDFCYREIPEKLDVFDTETFKNDPMVFYVGATDVKSGKCVFHKCSDGGDEDMQWMRASASMPIVSRIVQINDELLLDGGIADSIPLRFMEKEGYERNVVVLTQPKGYVKEKNKLMPLIRMSLKDYPLAVDAMAKRHLVYNHQVREVERKEKNGEVFVLRPPQALGIGRTEKDPKELRRVYELGRSEALKHLDEIKNFLSGKTEIKKEDMASRKKIRRHYHFIGTVQGVGFRFQAMMAADQLGLTGFVRNESDGSVTMEIQGEACEIDAAVEMINSGRFIHIEKTEVKEIPLKEGESSFSADYW